MEVLTKIYELGETVRKAAKGARANVKQCEIVGARVGRLVGVLQGAPASGVSQQRASALTGACIMRPYFVAYASQQYSTLPRWETCT